jgi:excisionase family DNA binding protein
MLLSTAQVAELLGVSAATVKRWAEAGLLPAARTRGGHRRFRRSEVERAELQHPGSGSVPVGGDEWIEQLLAPGPSLSLDSALMEARGALGAWHTVAEMLGPVIEELGRRWEQGRISALEEHVASARLSRALGRVAEGLPVSRAAPRVLLATPPGEVHALGLALAEVCFREAGRATVWAGVDVPVADLFKRISERSVSVVALSASVVAPPAQLAEVAACLGDACAAAGVALILGGMGAWPETRPDQRGSSPVEVIRTWTALRAWLLRHGSAPGHAPG